MRFAKPPTEVPLDDGTRYGTEPWREIDGVGFCHYDRWLLRLSLDEGEGLNSIVAEFHRRARRSGRTDEVAEAMLAQLADLAARLASVGRAPNDVLDDVERKSTWLRNKAFRRVWHATSLRRTEAMTRTPRNVLEARAREGNWSAFPVSPRPYYARLHAIYRGGYADYRAVGSVVFLMHLEGERMLGVATSDDERLGVRRAILGAAIEAMAHVDDSGDELGQHFRDEEQGYLALVRHYLERPGILRDLLELATWEDYGLFHHLDSFLSQLPEPAADVAVRELARIISEVRGAHLEYQRAKARQLRGIVLRSAALLAADREDPTDGG